MTDGPIRLELDLSAVHALAERFANADTVIGYEMRAAGVQIMEATRMLAIDNAPSDTGTLRDSIGAIKFNVNYPDFEIEVAAQTDYAKFVEEGTHNIDGSVRIAPRLFMRFASELMRDPAQQRINLAVKRATEKLAGG